MEGKQKFIGGIDFEELQAQRIQFYRTITVSLATAHTDKEIGFTGNYLYALEATDVDATFSIRFNERFCSLIPLHKGRGVRTPFYRFYITNTAQAGKTITLAIGVESETFEIFDVGKALEITGPIAGITDPVEVYGQNLANGWATEGSLVDPATDALLADTGGLDAGIYDFYIYIATSAAGMLTTLQHRNAANTANIKGQDFRSETYTGHCWIRGYSIAASERLRVIHGGSAGTVQVSIFHIKRQ